jgi:uncharacterized protein (TIGR00299 family) protein
VSQVLYLEPVGGIAGDMFLALAIDLGVAPDALTAALAGLKVPGWKLVPSRAVRHAIEGTHVDVVLDEGTLHPHRALSDIRALIQDANTMSKAAQARALAIFQVIGEAEAKIHGVPVDQVHFHEVGAVDSIVDVCGAAVAVELLGEPTLFSAPPPMGSGMVQTAHGRLPVPVPATLEILRGVPVRFEGVGELTTPTGAGLLKALAQIGAPPELTVEKVGYGVGTKDFRDRANVLRGSLGTAAHSFAGGTFVIEANLDDCSPQLLGHAMERLLGLGALDVYVAPVTMKKSRPGHVLGVVVGADQREAAVDCILRETPTLGVRFQRVERVALERRFETVQTPFGPVQVKLGLRDGKVVNTAPEFDDCRARALEKDVPLKEVWAAALAALGAR